MLQEPRAPKAPKIRDRLSCRSSGFIVSLSTVLNFVNDGGGKQQFLAYRGRVDLFVTGTAKLISSMFVCCLMSMTIPKTDLSSALDDFRSVHNTDLISSELS